MEIHRQTCQACQSRQLNNILVRAAGKPSSVYVRCAQCGELVATYELSRYYHHGKGEESYLRSLGGDTSDSGRNVLDEFRRAKREILEFYPKLLDELNAQGKEL